MYTLKQKVSLFFLLLSFLQVALTNNANAAAKREFYQLKIYHLKDQDQVNRLDKFLQTAYLPALHRAGIGKVGVFKPVEGQDNAPAATEKLVYVFIPFKSAAQIFKVEAALAKDKQFTTSGQDYLEAPHDNPPYNRFEVVLMEAFAGMPVFKAPALQAPSAERIYELRSYEAATEKLHENKIHMFNNGEMDIFSRLGFNAVFYGQVKAGGKMPNLMYMTSFENKAARDEHWKAFSADPAWKKLSALPEYAHNFLRADIYFLYPATYSEI